MSLFSQLGILFLIMGIAMVLMRTNRDLSKACEEGEHFIDEWALHLERKEEAARKSEEKRIEADRKARERQIEADREARMQADIEADWRARESRMDKRPEERVRFMPEISLHLLDDRGMVSKVVPVNYLPFTIGRDPDCDLKLNDICIARKHCRIIEEEGRPILLDLGTRNRILVDDVPYDRLPLSKGQHLAIGNTEIIIG